MSDENLHTYQNEDDAAKEFRLHATGDGLAEATAQVIAHDAEKKRHNANDQQGHDELG